MVTVESVAGRQTRVLQAGSGFLSQHSKDLFFGLGTSQGKVSAVIRWPSGLVQELKDLPAGHRVWVTEGSEASRVEPFKTRAAQESSAAVATGGEEMPESAETWLLVPVLAPGFRCRCEAGRCCFVSNRVATGCRLAR